MEENDSHLGPLPRRRRLAEDMINHAATEETILYVCKVMLSRWKVGCSLESERPRAGKLTAELRREESM